MDVLGIDIGGTSIKAACLRDGMVRWERQSSVYARPSLAELEGRLRECLGGERADVVGLCVPGATDERGMVTRSANVPGLEGVDLRTWMRQVAGCAKVEIDTDVHATAFDLSRKERRPGRLCVIALGTGVGMCVLTDGVRLSVNGTSSGHLGQIDVTLDDVPPVRGPDGGAGGLEGYIGLAALKARYGEDLAAAIAMFDEKAAPLRALARAVRIVHAIYRPDEITLAGGVGIMLRAARLPLERLVRDGLTNLARPEWRLSFAEDGFHAARGMAALAAQDITQARQT